MKSRGKGRPPERAGVDALTSLLFFFSSRRRHTRFDCDWSSDVCSSDYALEAVFGAVFLDGGYQAARAAVLKAFGPLVERLDPEQPAKDPKTQLQEMLQAKRQRLPEYRVLSMQGAAHRQSFEGECGVAELGLTATGSGTSRQRAEQQAARAMLEQLSK